MTDAALAMSAIGPLYEVGSFGAPGAAGVVLTERRRLAVVQLAAFPDAAAAVATRLRTHLGAPVPQRPNTSATAGALTVLWLGPNRWLCVASASHGAVSSLAGAFTAAQAAVTDLSHGRTVIRIDGPSARDLLAKGCKLDLHRRAFTAGACAVSQIAHVGAILHAVAPESVDVYVPRSYAQHFWEWLLEAAAEFGCRVDPPLVAATEQP